VTLIEKHKLGGDCLNTGCVPSKALIRSAKFLSHLSRAEEFGFRASTKLATSAVPGDTAAHNFQFSEVMERVQRVVKTVEPHDSVERYTGLGVDVIEGSAKIVSPWEVEFVRHNGATGKLSTRSIVIAAGARPFVPPIPGIEEVGYLTSDNLWELRELPERLLVLGGGPIGCELTQAFARLGSRR
jgi:pyruvate/2-oxoglutarate dehydrogenase complex dihydrolipoamide dehydrogenase (E3) component